MIFYSQTASFIFLSWFRTWTGNWDVTYWPPPTPQIKQPSRHIQAESHGSRACRVLKHRRVERRGEKQDWKSKEAGLWESLSLGKNSLKYFAAIRKMKMLSRKWAKCPHRASLAVIPGFPGRDSNFTVSEFSADLSKMYILSSVLQGCDWIWVQYKSRNLDV